HTFSLTPKISFMGIMTQTVVLYKNLGRLLDQLCDVGGQTETTRPVAQHRFRLNSKSHSLNSGDYSSICTQNGETAEIYRSHKLKSKDGKIICPILRSYISPGTALTRVATANRATENRLTVNKNVAYVHYASSFKLENTAISTTPVNDRCIKIEHTAMQSP
uniref:Nanos-type domain-containing protein n=1 Tax=Hucho hucho TaxID=62062 RepID=A0A4W5LL52_9TELE